LAQPMVPGAQELRWIHNHNYSVCLEVTILPLSNNG
jgi:hypothetical protein